jgi:hypothetical protein
LAVVLPFQCHCTLLQALGTVMTSQLLKLQPRDTLPFRAMHIQVKVRVTARKGLNKLEQILLVQ